MKDKIKKLFLGIKAIARFVVKAFSFIIFNYWKCIFVCVCAIIFYNINKTYKHFLHFILNCEFVKTILLNQFYQDVYIPLYVLELVVLIYSYFKIKSIVKTRGQNKIQKVRGLRNAENQPPIYLKSKKLWSNLKITKRVFKGNGLGVERWKDTQIKDDIQNAFNCTLIGEPKEKINSHEIIEVMTASPRYRVPNKVYLKEKNLDNNSTKFLLGENLLGIITIDIKKDPHVLLAGSSGSGKSVQLDNIIFQAMNKGYILRICDPKRTEFNGWNNLSIKPTYSLNNGYNQIQCSVSKTLTDALEDLREIQQELFARENKFEIKNVRDIDEYNKENTIKLSRIIYIFDEFVEISITKDKEISKEIEDILTEIATRGRSLGIHFVLSAQRPDCKLLEGQIKSNLQNRICGYVPDKSSSEVVLGKGNYDGTTLISQDDKGVFVTNKGQRLKGYYLDTKTITKVLHEKYDKQNIGGTNNVEQ